MENREIAKQFDLLAKLMELHGENPFKIRSYSSAYQTLRRMDQDLSSYSEEELMTIKGIGKAVASKTREWFENGKMNVLEEYKAKTPQGVIDVLMLKGLGPKKVKILWDKLDISSLGELEYACKENRLLSLKGFGQKTQLALLEQIDFIRKNSGQVLLSEAMQILEDLLKILRKQFPGERFESTGPLRRKLESIARLDIIGTLEEDAFWGNIQKLLDDGPKEDSRINALPLHYHFASKENFAAKWFESTGPASFIALFSDRQKEEEKDIFKARDLPFIHPEYRDVFSESPGQNIPERLSMEHIRGVIHSHSTWSDGSHSILQMAKACQDAGYQYLVMSDHSKSAFYANGLNEDRILQQWKEIDEINAANPGFRIFKGIESDILNDGNLDYDTGILSQFEVVIASVHSNLRMDEEKANARLLKAIEHPSTNILGHMTGRLLLSRPGYPLDYQKIIDACAANEVAIEINANPHRLDIDWRWIPYALEKGVQICLSPDAHNTRGIKDMKYGVWMAQKGGVGPAQCPNCLDTLEFAAWAAGKA
jgi:DNA polymerase (family 10)